MGFRFDPWKPSKTKILKKKNFPVIKKEKKKK